MPGYELAPDNPIFHLEGAIHQESRCEYGIVLGLRHRGQSHAQIFAGNTWVLWACYAEHASDEYLQGVWVSSNEVLSWNQKTNRKMWEYDRGRRSERCEV